MYYKAPSIEINWTFLMCFSCLSPVPIDWESMNFSLIFHKLIMTWWCHKAMQNLVIISLGQGLPMNRWQAINWTNAAILSIRCLETNFSKTGIKYHDLISRKCMKMLSAKCWPFVEAINVLKLWAHPFSFGKAHTPYMPPYCSLIPWYWCHKGDWKVKWLDNNYKCPEIT